MKQDNDCQLEGFSSEEDVREDQSAANVIQTRSRKPTIIKQPKLMLPPANDIASRVYNLTPDTLTGWKPRLLLPRPVPLTFGYTIIQATINCLQKSKNFDKICYLGPRQQNSYYLHMNKSYEFPYSHIAPPDVINLTNRKFVGNTDCNNNLKFDSMFESGNLDCAIKIADDEYDLFMRPDTNTKGHLQWFNFKIKNAVKKKNYKFNICNFQKHHSLYTRGMKPFIYSEKLMAERRIGWQQTGSNIKYQRKYGRYSIDQYTIFYRLSFEYQFQYANDEVQFSYCIPYTYSHLLSFLTTLGEKDFVNINKLTTSLGSLQVPFLTITAEDNSKKSVTKKCIIISARTHPGQSNSSFMMHGFLQFICGNSSQALFLRKYVVFMIIPMLNVDGVIAGNHRTGLSGKDFNRQFVNPDKFILPEISALKDLVVKSKQTYGKNLLFFLDFHGHSIKKNVFIYGPQYPIRESQYYECKIFPKMLGNQTPMFRYYSCIFRVAQCKQTTARAILFKKLNIPFAYTLQASNGYFYDKQKLENVMFNDKLWQQMGQTIVRTMHKYCQQLIQADVIREQKCQIKKARDEIRIKNKSLEGKKLLKQNCKKQSHKLLYKRPSPDLKSYDSKTIDEPQPEPEPVVIPESFRNIMQQIKKQEVIMQQNTQIQKDASIGSQCESKQSDDSLPEQVMQFIVRSIKSKKAYNLNLCNTYIQFPQDKMKLLDQPRQQTVINLSESPVKKSLELSPKKQCAKSNSSKIAMNKTTFYKSRSAQPKQRKSHIFLDEQASHQVEYIPKHRIINLEPMRYKYLNVKGSAFKRQQKCYDVINGTAVDSLKKTYNYYKLKQGVATFTNDTFNKVFSRTTRKSYLFKDSRSSNYSSLLQQYQ